MIDTLSHEVWKIKTKKQKKDTYIKITIPRKREKQECRQKQNEKKCLKYKNDIHNPNYIDSWGHDHSRSQPL